MFTDGREVNGAIKGTLRDILQSYLKTSSGAHTHNYRSCCRSDAPQGFAFAPEMFRNAVRFPERRRLHARFG